jgi:Domain of unknown function (DUF5658)
VDCLDRRWLFLLALILVFNCFDSISTFWVVLRDGGRELNPIIQSTIDFWGENFWIWKLVFVSSGLVILGLHSQFRMVKITIFLLYTLYVGLVSYQLTVILNYF